MSSRLPLLSVALAAAAMTLVSCSGSGRTHISGIVDLPLKTTQVPDFSWQQSPLRANSKYLLYGTNTARQKKERLGDYYYVDWYDADPSLPVKLVMHYTQARTASQIHTRSIDYDAPRKSPRSYKAEFFFNGEARKLGGDILTWRMELYVDGKMVDSQQSYLWE